MSTFLFLHPNGKSYTSEVLAPQTLERAVVDITVPGKHLTVATTSNPACFALLVEANDTVLRKKPGASVLHSQKPVMVLVLSFLPVLGYTVRNGFNYGHTPPRTK